MPITRSQSNKRRCRCSKRRRTSSSPRGHTIANLPSDILSTVAQFLPKTSVALWAVAYSGDADTTDQSSETSIAIISSFEESSRDEEPWAVMDFLDIELDLRIKLTDDDVANVLRCINATEKLKTLKLTHLFEVIGSGLEPLRESSVLEQLDLTQERQHYSCDLSRGRLCDKSVVSILNSIINNDKAALCHLQFPQKWFGGDNRTIQDFLEKYDDFLSKKEICCSCDSICKDGMFCKAGGQYLDGLQMLTCYSCTETICNECQDNGITSVIKCKKCKKMYCDECLDEVVFCELCDSPSCAGCNSVNYCSDCDMFYCDLCGHGSDTDWFSDYSDY